LMLLDAGFLGHGLLGQIHSQGAYFCLRLRRRWDVRTPKQLSQQSGAADLRGEGAPKDSRGNRRQEQVPPSLTLRLWTYPPQGFRPRRRRTDLRSAPEVPDAQCWGLSVSAQGRGCARAATTGGGK